MKTSSKELADELQKLQLEEEANQQRKDDDQMINICRKRKPANHNVLYELQLKEISGAYNDKPKGLIVIADGPRWKRDCSALLDELMKHPAAWAFNEPMDPMRLNIPDYYPIISNPMDLGTIKSKLANNAYLGIEDFVADIRLTFSNAMGCNPPYNYVRMMAEKMKDFFETRWNKSLNQKWKIKKC